MTAADPAFRRDIEGLRGLAVALIVLYHAGLLGLGGGYVGVDVFFVISGYLITGLLLTEHDRDGSIAFARFYARRARRILPAAFLVLGATTAGAALIESPLKFRATAVEIAAAASYVPNLLFAAQATDYLRPLRDPPVLHYWSLGVEEQFYLFWPVLLGLAGKVLGGRVERLARPVAVIVVGSFVLCAVVTVFKPADAFFLLPMRAWELGLGALIVIIERRGVSHPRLHWLGPVGLGMILLAAILFSASTPYPGLASTLPVVGAGFVIAAGSRASVGFSSALLTMQPLQFIGRVSYSLYLWHWPLFVLLATAVAQPSFAEVASVVAISMLLAALTYRLVERPFRDGVLIGTRPTANIGLAVIGSIAIASASLLTGRLLTLRFDGPAVALSSSALADTRPTLLAPLMSGSLPPGLIPPLARVDETVPLPTLDGCNVTADRDSSGPCTYGAADARTTVVLFGDSHALHWFPAIEQFVLERGWRLVNLTKDSCPYADIPRLTYGPRPDIACAVWRTSALERISQLRPRFVIVSSNHTIVPSVGQRNATAQEARELWQQGIHRTLQSLVPFAGSVVVMGDTPESPWDVPDCLSLNADHIERCGIARDVAVDSEWSATERAIAMEAGAHYVDPSDWICPRDPCSVIRGRFLVFTDANHLAWPFVVALTHNVYAAVAGQ